MWNFDSQFTTLICVGSCNLNHIVGIKALAILYCVVLLNLTIMFIVVAWKQLSWSKDDTIVATDGHTNIFIQ